MVIDHSTIASSSSPNQPTNILCNILLGLAALTYLVPVQFFLTSRVSHKSVSGRKEYSSRPDKNPGPQLAGELNNGGSMSQFSYVAVNSRGLESRGSMDVSDQPHSESEAIKLR